MTTIAASDFRQQLAELGNRVGYGGERITVTRSGKPLFAVVPYEDAELLEALEERMDLDLGRQALRRYDTVAWAQAKKELGL
ncbi:MAG: type II toxin-antitoxin system Phd/YefM family antitoxin [Phycisphaerales bacterium]|nr:MAG: type II toxin-antitoxin system Phd/YefM family antitoxin [Phycisphaerales bacterium]